MEGPCKCRIHVRTDVTMGHMKAAYNKFLEAKEKEQNRGDQQPNKNRHSQSNDNVQAMLTKILGKYGSRSGVLCQLSSLMKENDQMKRLVIFNKSLQKGGVPSVANNNDDAYARNGGGISEDQAEKDFISRNKYAIRKSLDQKNEEKGTKTKLKAKKMID